MTQGMPPSRAIMTVDTVRFSHNPSQAQPALSAGIPKLIERTFGSCGHPEVWDGRRFDRSTGDGFMFGVVPEQVAYLLHPFLDRLQETLEEENRLLRAQSRDLRMRLRVAVNAGPVPDDGGAADGIGTPTNDTFRLMDSDVIRHAMKTSNPDVTLVAAIVSQRVFEDAVRAGFTGDLHPDRFEQVTAEVDGKDFAQPGWMYVPKPSRLETPAAAAPAEPTIPAIAPAINATNSVSGGINFGHINQNGGRP